MHSVGLSIFKASKCVTVNDLTKYIQCVLITVTSSVVNLVAGCITGWNPRHSDASGTILNSCHIVGS